MGCCGAGKSTLAKKLHDKTKLPLIHLDKLYWQPNWIESTTVEWEQMVEEVSDTGSWIIDGNYGGTLDIRLAKADTIIFLDRPTWLCLYRVLKRTIQYYGKNRFDMPNGCNERFDFNFLKYVYRFNKIKRDNLLYKVENYRGKKSVFILDSDKKIQQFLSNIGQYEKHH